MTTTLFHFHNPHDPRFARAVHRGTWYPHPTPDICPECHASREWLVPPLIIEWRPESDVVGDFTWPGLDDEIVISQRVIDAFEKWPETRGVTEYLTIEMVQDPKLKRPTRPNKRTKPRVWLPYEGPQLWELKPTSVAHLDMEASGWSIDKVCGTCGNTFYNLPPFEQRRLVVDPSTWNGAGVFRIHESGWIFCTERPKMRIEEAGFTNVSFLEDGIIPV